VIGLVRVKWKSHFTAAQIHYARKHRKRVHCSWRFSLFKRRSTPCGYNV